MADTGSVRVAGARELRAALREMDTGLARQMTPIHKHVAEYIVPRAQAITPRRSGDLAASITARATITRARIVATMPYAAPIHWGWPTHHIDPTYYVVNAAEASEPGWLEIYINGVQDLIDRAVSTSGAGNPL